MTKTQVRVGQHRSSEELRQEPVLKIGRQRFFCWTNALALAETKLPKLDSGDLGPAWNTVLIAHILMREAKELIQGGAATGHAP